MSEDKPSLEQKYRPVKRATIELELNPFIMLVIDEMSDYPICENCGGSKHKKMYGVLVCENCNNAL